MATGNYDVDQIAIEMGDLSLTDERNDGYTTWKETERAKVLNQQQQQQPQYAGTTQSSPSASYPGANPPPALPPKKKQKLTFQSDDYSRLKNLRFDKYIQGKMEGLVTCEVNNKSREMILECQPDKIGDLQQYINDFKDSIRSTTAEFASPDCNKLLLKRSGENNDVVWANLLKQVNCMPCDLDIEFDKDNEPRCKIVYTDYNDMKKAKTAVEKSIVKEVCQKKYYKKIEETVNFFEKKNSLKILGENETYVSYVCTKETFDKISDEYQQAETVTLSEPFMSYIKNKGKPEFEMMQEECYVDIQLVPDRQALVIKGSHRHIKQCKEKLKNMFEQRNKMLFCTSTQLRAIENKIQWLEERSNCSASIDVKKNGIQIEKWRNVVSWKHGKYGRCLTLIAGYPEHSHFGVMLMLVDQNMSPLDQQLKEEYGHQLEIVRGGSNPQICILPSPFGVVQLSAEDMQRLDKNTLSEKILAKLALVRERREFKKIALVGIPPNHKELKFVASEFFNVSQRYIGNEVFICCSPTQICNVFETIDDEYFKLTKHQLPSEDRFGYYREIHDFTFFPVKEIHSIQVIVDDRSILKVEADVLVNTVGTDLDLNLGQLSKQILKEAGYAIQKELKDKAGVMPCKTGACLVTTAGNLSERQGAHRTKNIVHCVLPRFKKESFTQNLKDMVRKCLIESDVQGCHSIAFPAFGTGKLGYPTHETAKAMFDAVEDYQHQAINPTLRTVFFSSTDKTFKQEETIRRQKNGQEEFGLTLEGLTRLQKKTKLKEGTVLLHVVVKKEMDDPPPNAIVVILMRDKSYEMRQHGPEANTHWILEIHLRYSDENSLKDGFNKIWKTCVSARCTELIVHIFPDDESVPSKQINAICDSVEQECPGRYLRNIVFTLHESDAVNLVKNELVCGMLSLTSLGNTFRGRGDEMWQKIQGSKREVCIRLIGSTTKDVHDAELFILKQDSDDGDTQTLTGSAQLKSAEKADAQELEVSARINAGVLNYLKEWKDLSDWKDQIRNVIKVNIKNGRAFGTHDAIIKFWNYLENEFPEPPSNPTTDMQEQHDLEIIYFGDFTINVKRASIVESKTDCIVCLNGSTLMNTGGVAGALKTAGGKEYVTDLEKNVKDFGKLSTGECRVTGSGKLHSKKVMHIHFPSFKDNYDINMQKLLELALFMSLETADAHGFKSMSFPVLGTGQGGLTVQHCVNSYARVFSEANGKLKNTRNIFVYAFEENAHIFSQAFRNLHVINNASLERGCFNIGERKIEVVNHDLYSNTFVDVIVSKKDGQLSGNSSSAQNIERLGDEAFFSKKNILKKNCPLPPNGVVSQDSSGGQLMNVAIIHLNEPRWNSSNDINAHERNIFQSITNVLKEVESLRKSKVGIELIGESDDDKRYPTPVYRCCSAMIQAIIHYFTSHPNSDIKSIEFTSASKEHREAFCYLINVNSAKLWSPA